MTTIDFNADLGESFGAWRLGDDAAMLELVTSANVACGFHAGDPLEMSRVVALCAQKGVGIGAHPGFDDLAGFGRRQIIGLSGAELGAMVLYQIGALQAIAKAAGLRVGHVKLHGALSNMCMRDRAMADAIMGAVHDLDPQLAILAVAGTEIERAALAQGSPIVREVFADRAYDDQGMLVARDKPGAVIHDPELAAENILRMVEEQAITSQNGARIPVHPESICVHGDGASAVALARRVRARLEAAGIRISRWT